MKVEQSGLKNSNSYYRLIAVWVLCEALAGGMFHAIKIPGSGLIVGGAAVVCISLIAHTEKRRGAILKAALIVAIFKMLLSPHTPATAYIAVGFQGLIGELFFLTMPYKLSCICLGILALVESAIQRILVLTIIYGMAFWRAVSEFLKKLTGDTSGSNYSFYLAIAYVFLHAIVGFFIGWYASRLPEKINSWKLDSKYLININEAEYAETHSAKKTKTRFFLWGIWIVLVILLILPFFDFSTSLLPQSLILNILIRSIVIVLTWYLLLGPILLHFIKKYLRKQKEKMQPEIVTITDLLPHTRSLMKKAWNVSSSDHGFTRIKTWAKLVLANTF